MDFTIILYIVIAFIIGVVVTFVFKRKEKNSVDKSQLTTLLEENESLKTELSNLSTEKESLKTKLFDTENKLGQIETDSSNKVEEIKKKFEALLNEANSQSAKLDSQLKNALAGKIDDSITEQLAEVDKLKKTIKNLEDDLEEANEDLSDVQKKLKSKDADIADLQDNYAKEQKKSSELNSELSTVKANLKEKIEELNLKMESLNFVQEILSAPEVNRNDVKQIDENIAEMKSFALGQLIDCYATLKDRFISFNDGRFDEYKKYWELRFKEWASVTRKSWINGKTTIAFVGEFSAGKTSIVNRILSQDNPSAPQLPVSATATTAVATYIAGGPIESYQFVTPDDKLKSISQKTFTDKVKKEVLDQVKGVSSLIKYFVMTYKNPNLNGLSVLDTPGFNSNDKNDSIRTMEVINECDALFWVFDVNVGTVNRSSIKIIKENLNKPLYIIINKVDTKADSDVQNVENLIRKTLNDEGLKVERYIRFSTKAPLSSIMDQIKNVKHLAEKEQYLSDLGNVIEENLRVLNQQVKDADNEYRQAEDNGQRIDEKFIQQMRTLWEHCNTAASIPHYEEHIFKKDNYEMSQGEYGYLCDVLNESCSDVESMGRIYDEKTDSAFAVQKAWTKVCEFKAAWQRVDEIKTQFEKIRKKF